VYLKSFTIYWSESRGPQYFVSLVGFLTSIGIVYSSPTFWVLLAFIVYVPYITFTSLDVCTFIGKKCAITDDDFAYYGIRFNAPENSTYGRDKTWKQTDSVKISVAGIQPPGDSEADEKQLELCARMGIEVEAGINDTIIA